MHAVNYVIHGYLGICDTKNKADDFFINITNVFHVKKMYLYLSNSSPTKLSTPMLYIYLFMEQKLTLKTLTWDANPESLRSGQEKF